MSDVGDGKQGGPMEHLAEGLRERGLGDRCGCGEVDGAMHGSGDEVENGAHFVVE